MIDPVVCLSSKKIAQYVKTGLFNINTIEVSIGKGWVAIQYAMNPHEIVLELDKNLFSLKLRFLSSSDVLLYVVEGRSRWSVGYSYSTVTSEYIFENILNKEEQELFLFNLDLLKT